MHPDKIVPPFLIIRRVGACHRSLSTAKKWDGFNPYVKFYDMHPDKIVPPFFNNQEGGWVHVINV